MPSGFVSETDHWAGKQGSLSTKRERGSRRLPTNHEECAIDYESQEKQAKSILFTVIAQTLLAGA